MADVSGDGEIVPIPYYQDELVTIYHGDCRRIVPVLNWGGPLITDPPYGINWKPRVNHRDSVWVDDDRPDLRPLLVGSCHFVFGGNYFTDQLPPSESWFVWIKRPAGYNFDNDSRTYSVMEMGWSDFGGKPRMRHHVWDGGMRAGDSLNRDFCHPAQKPVEVMRWIVAACPDQSGTILDPFAGSGSTLRAAKDAGRKAIGVELVESYCEVAANRLAQGSLFGGVDA